MQMPKNQKCLMCDAGTYVDMGIHSSTDLHNSGLGAKLVGGIAWTAVQCDRCGNVQTFLFKRSEDQMRGDRW